MRYELADALEPLKEISSRPSRRPTMCIHIEPMAKPPEPFFKLSGEGCNDICTITEAFRKEIASPVRDVAIDRTANRNLRSV